MLVIELIGTTHPVPESPVQCIVAHVMRMMEIVFLDVPREWNQLKWAIRKLEPTVIVNGVSSTDGVEDPESPEVELEEPNDYDTRENRAKETDIDETAISSCKGDWRIEFMVHLVIWIKCRGVKHSVCPVKEAFEDHKADH